MMHSKCGECGNSDWELMPELPEWAPQELLDRVELFESAFGQFFAFRCRSCGDLGVQFGGGWL